MGKHIVVKLQFMYELSENVAWLWPRPLKGQFVISMLKHHVLKWCTEFEVSSFSHYGDILGGNKNLNGSHDYNYAPFRDGLSSVGWD